jgi:hypothetical protein
VTQLSENGVTGAYVKEITWQDRKKESRKEPVLPFVANHFQGNYFSSKKLILILSKGSKHPSDLSTFHRLHLFFSVQGVKTIASCILSNALTLSHNYSSKTHPLTLPHWRPSFQHMNPLGINCLQTIAVLSRIHVLKFYYSA